MVSVAVAVISAIAVAIVTGLMTHFKKQANTYKTMMENAKTENLRNTIQEELEPIIEEINRLNERISNCESCEGAHLNTILTSYKFRLVYLCKTYLRQGYMTEDQYDQLSEFYKVYHDLGGNGQAQEYYERAKKLQVKRNEEE